MNEQPNDQGKQEERLTTVKAEALLWELCYRLEAREWFVTDFDPGTIERLRLALRLYEVQGEAR